MAGRIVPFDDPRVPNDGALLPSAEIVGPLHDGMEAASSTAALQQSYFRRVSCGGFRRGRVHRAECSGSAEGLQAGARKCKEESFGVFQKSWKGIGCNTKKSIGCDEEKGWREVLGGS